MRWAARRSPGRAERQKQEVQQAGCRRHQQGAVKVVARHCAQVTRAAPGVDGEIGVEAGEYLLPDTPRAVHEDRHGHYADQQP